VSSASHGLSQFSIACLEACAAGKRVPRANGSNHCGPLPRRPSPFAAEASKTEPLELAWPAGVIALSHVALSVPPDDPLYGQRPPDNEDVLFLGQMAIQGERGLFILPSDWLLRLWHNPFYAYLEARVLAWMDRAAGYGNDGTGLSTPEGPGVGVTPPKQ